MTTTIAGITFDNVLYDPEGDVLYLHVGDPKTAVAFDESPEGHALRLDSAGNIVGITLVRPRHVMARGETVVVTIPAQQPAVIDPSVLSAALHAA
ncbi:MAG TPA: DUF2283 domain-containing protein [Candidatus Dormibacteraeota bacterium]